MRTYNSDIDWFVLNKQLRLLINYLNDEKSNVYLTKEWRKILSELNCASSSSINRALKKNKNALDL